MHALVARTSLMEALYCLFAYLYWGAGSADGTDDERPSPVDASGDQIR